MKLQRGKIKGEKIKMETIVGAIIIKENKILMVKEAKKKCYSKWAFPAGHLEKGETILEGAKRETLEETGCKVELEKAFPILVGNIKDKNIMMIHFLADLVEDNLLYNTDEILETKWIDIEQIKNMKEEEFRSYEVVKNILENLEEQNLYDLNIIKDVKKF